MIRFWSAAATPAQVPSGATGESSTPTNSAGRAAHNCATTRLCARGSTAAGRTKRSSRQRLTSRAASTRWARVLATSSSNVCRSVGDRPSSSTDRASAGSSDQTRCTAGRDLSVLPIV